MKKTILSKQERTIIHLAGLGGMLEFYDFIIYGIFSVYFASQFFPSQDKFIVIIQSYLIFISGYLARPLGGVIFSSIGHELGTKKILILTILMMGTASLGIGLLPTYSQIGIAAPLLLLTLRIMQGLAIGGELPSTYVYISETLIEKQGIAFGKTMTAVNSGLLLGMFINFLLTSCLDSNQLMQFGWRIPFILGGLICLVSYQIRKKLHETGVLHKNSNQPKLPIVYLFKNHFSDFLIGVALVSLMSSLVVLTIIFMPTYLHDFLHIETSRISYLMTFFMIVNVCSIYCSGRIAQYMNPFIFLKKLVLCSFVGIIAAYSLIGFQQILIGLVILAILQGASAMITPYISTCLFESNIRLTGVAISYNLGFTLFGGLAPLIITYLMRLDYNPYLMPVAYLLIMLVICKLGLRAYFKRDLMGGEVRATTVTHL